MKYVTTYVMIAATVSYERSCLEVLGTEGMITIEFKMAEECRDEVARNNFVRSINRAVR